MFTDREDAARQLADVFEAKNYPHPIILALPRGGVPLGRIIADRLGAPLDVLLVQKLGAPGNPEVAIGAVGEGSGADQPVMFIDEPVAQMVGASESYLKGEVENKLTQIRARRELYGDRAQFGNKMEMWAGKTVIIIDDGIATGSTISAAIKLLKAAGVGHVVVGVPVAPADTVARLSREVDEMICLEMPEPFYAIGMHYQTFGQVDDQDVMALLDPSE